MLTINQDFRFWVRTVTLNSKLRLYDLCLCWYRRKGMSKKTRQWRALFTPGWLLASNRVLQIIWLPRWVSSDTETTWDSQSEEKITKLKVWLSGSSLCFLVKLLKVSNNQNFQSHQLCFYYFYGQFCKQPIQTCCWVKYHVHFYLFSKQQ